MDLKGNFFVSGGTGFVGRHIIKEVLLSNEENTVTLLVRNDRTSDAASRIESIISELFDDELAPYLRNRIQIVQGNITEKNFGLDKKDFDNLAKPIDYIFHAAAAVKFNLPLDEAWEINVIGTQNMLDFASRAQKHGTLKMMAHISTAYVVGKQNLWFKHYTPVFSNTYEQTKFEAESLVNKYIANGLPVSIFRPSIVTGHSKTGEIAPNSVIFKFMQLFSRELLTSFPCEEDSSLNIIPINYFIQMMFDLIKNDSTLGNTYNITHTHNINVRDMINTTCEHLDVHKIDFQKFENFRTTHQKQTDSIGVFLPYIKDSHVFDMDETLSQLKYREIESCNVDDWIRPVIAYGIKKGLLKKNILKH